MLFNSVEFAIFLPVVFLVYWILPQRFRWPLILLASYLFYAWVKPAYVLILFVTTLISYFTALLIEKRRTVAEKRWAAGIGVFLVLGILFAFKYLNFAIDSAADFIGVFTSRPDVSGLSLVLPVGISFYTFQTVGYIVDVYRGTAPAEKHFGIYAAFVSFFPQILAGPIARSRDLIPQIRKEKVFDEKTASYGLKQMCWGFFKKIVIADRIAFLISDVFDAPMRFAGFPLLAAVVLFSIRIYCDFSGYSDIAIGTAKLLGLELSTNFRSPYFSGSLRDFWSRWHISLSTWFRDYVYIPLGGNRKGKMRQILNIMITFLLSGLWHGADWSFVLWGGIHGLGRSFEELVLPKEREIKNKGLRILRGALVLVFCVFTWVFFAARNIGDSFYIIANMFKGLSSPVSYVTSGISALGLDLRNLVILLISVGLLTVFDAFSLKTDVITCLSGKKTVVRWIIYIAFAVCLILFIPGTRSTDFIYFRF